MKMPVAPPTQLTMPSTALPAIVVRIEAEPQEIVHGAAGLRDAGRIDLLHVAGERIGDAGIVLLGTSCETREIAHRREAEAGHHRILRHIGELIECALPERRGFFGESDRRAGFVGIVPLVGQDHRRRVVVADAYSEGGFRLVERCGRIGERPGESLAIFDDEFFHRRAGQWRAVGFATTGAFMVKLPPPAGALMSQPLIRML